MQSHWSLPHCGDRVEETQKLVHQTVSHWKVHRGWAHTRSLHSPTKCNFAYFKCQLEQLGSLNEADFARLALEVQTVRAHPY